MSAAVSAMPASRRWCHFDRSGKHTSWSWYRRGQGGKEAAESGGVVSVHVLLICTCHSDDVDLWLQAGGTVQRPIFGPPAASEPGPTGQVVVMGQPYYKEA